MVHFLCRQPNEVETNDNESQLVVLAENAPEHQAAHDGYGVTHLSACDSQRRNAA